MNTENKILSLAHARDLSGEWRGLGESIVLANGCFDILHVGHLRYLRAARALGSRLIVAVNDDESVRALKGPGRPILSAAERARLLAALRAVDAVVIFSTPTVAPLLEALRPAIHAKGTDYTRDSIPERAAAERLGIQGAIAGDPKHHATRELLAEIRRRGH